MADYKTPMHIDQNDAELLMFRLGVKSASPEFALRVGEDEFLKEKQEALFRREVRTRENHSYSG